MAIPLLGTSQRKTLRLQWSVEGGSDLPDFMLSAVRGTQGERCGAIYTAEAREDGSLPPGAEPSALAQVLYQMWLGAALLAKLTRSRAPMQRAMIATEQILVCTPQSNHP